MVTKKNTNKFIKGAIKNPGALTKAVGGPPSKNLSKVKKLAKGSGINAQRAKFYLQVLKPATSKKKRKNNA